MSLHCNESELEREKEVIVGLLSYRDGAMWEEERAEWRQRERARERNSNQTRRRRRAEALSECPRMVNLWTCNPKKNPFVCGKCFYCFLVVSAAAAPGYVSDIKRILFASCPTGFDDNSGGLGRHQKKKINLTNKVCS